MLLASCVNAPIDCRVFHNFRACAARCSTSCVNWAQDHFETQEHFSTKGQKKVWELTWIFRSGSRDQSFEAQSTLDTSTQKSLDVAGVQCEHSHS